MMKDKCPIQQQIVSSEDIIKDLMERIKCMEERLRLPELNQDKKKVIELELQEIKKLLTTNKELLEKLHKENTKSFAVAACIVFICFFLYGLYVMIYGV